MRPDGTGAAAAGDVGSVAVKSFFDSRGVAFRNGQFEPPNRYKLFRESALRSIVLQNLAAEMVEIGACAPNPRVTLCLAVGKLAKVSDRKALEAMFATNGWRLFDAGWIRARK